MGQCFSSSRSQDAPRERVSRANLPYPTAVAAGQGTTPANANANPAQPDPSSWAQQAPQGGPPPVQGNAPVPWAPRRFKNRFIDRANELINNFPPSQQAAIRRLADFDQKKHSGITNKELRSFEALVGKSDPDVRAAAERTASFLLAKDVMMDTVQTMLDVCDPRKQKEAACTQLLLSMQAESLYHQVEIGKDALRVKMLDGTRIRPMLMDEAQFNNFLHHQYYNLHALINCCDSGSNGRSLELERILTSMATTYLESTNRAPIGIWGQNKVTIYDLEFHDAKVDVCVDREEDKNCIPDKCSSATYYHPEPRCDFGVIFIRSEDCIRAGKDPAKGGPNEEFYAQGFEHLDRNIPKKQAAVYIQKLFWELEYLEVEVAEYHAKNFSWDNRETRLADSSQADRNYRGSKSMGDRHDQDGLDPDNQRKALIDQLCGLNVLVNGFSTEESPVFLPVPDVQAWVKSPKFVKDMAGLAHPEHRWWVLSNEHVKNALLQNPLFREP